MALCYVPRKLQDEYETLWKIIILRKKVQQYILKFYLKWKYRLKKYKAQNAVEHVSNQPKHNNVSICPGKLDNANTLCLVYAAFDTYAVLTKTHSAADILQSDADGLAGDQLNHTSTLSSL